MKTELIVSTYNSPRALTLTLLSVAQQEVMPDSICIADDGSGPATAAAIAAVGARFPQLKLRHEWHEDRGFEKNVILNRAIATSDAEYLIFIDGDCMICPGFVKRHLQLSRIDRFLSGSLIRLSAEATAVVKGEDVLSGKVFSRRWLRSVGALTGFSGWLRSAPLPMPILSLLERIYPVQRNWCGANGSAYRSAILAVNGLDETMKYGGGDKEFGIRLANNGVRGRHIRFSAPLVHLDHPRGYKDAEKIREHRDKIAFARKSGKVWTEAGIKAQR